MTGGELGTETLSWAPRVSCRCHRRAAAIKSIHKSRQIGVLDFNVSSDVVINWQPGQADLLTN